MAQPMFRCPRCGSFAVPDEETPAPLRCSNCGGILESTGVGEGTATTPYRARSSAAPSFAPALLVRGFRLLGELGRGGMGLVYRARQLSLEREVALKVLPPLLAADPDRLERFRREATLAASLTASHVLPVFDVVDADGVPVLVLPFIDGPNLGRLVEDRRTEQARDRDRLAADREYLDRLLPLLDQLVEAVAVIHRADILHRDIKPSNLLVDREGGLWLADFGLARLGRESGGTAPGQAVGTPGYMSPEQAAGRQDLDGRADLFSVGVTIYWALTLRAPYGTDKVDEAALLPPPPSRHQPLLSSDMDAVLLKALEPDRRHRYATAAALRDDWRRVRQGLVPHARRLGRLGHLGRRLRRHRWLVGTVAISALLLTALGAVALRPAAPPPGRFVRDVRLDSEPPGAAAVLVPIDEYGELQPDRAIRPPGKTPLTVPAVPPGEYLMVVRVIASKTLKKLQ